MNTRSVVTSPPAVAGFVLLVLVVSAILGVRSGMNDDGDTGVAGTVIERSEVAEVPTSDPIEPSEPVIVRPAPDPEPAETQPPAPDQVVATAPQPPAPAPQVGLIPDESAPEGDTGNGGGQNNDGDRSGNDGSNNDPRPQPEPEPTREPRPAPEPEPEPEPTQSPDPEPEANTALKDGEGYSEDTAIAESWGGWTFREVARHDTGGPDLARSAKARLNVGFNPASQNADPNKPGRNLRCTAWLTAGDRDLTTDTEHIFTISLYESDEYGKIIDPTMPVISTQIRQAFTLEAGDDTRSDAGLLATDPVPVNAADGKHYTCAASYTKI